MSDILGFKPFWNKIDKIIKPILLNQFKLYNTWNRIRVEDPTNQD